MGEQGSDEHLEQIKSHRYIDTIDAWIPTVLALLLNDMLEYVRLPIAHELHNKLSRVIIWIGRGYRHLSMLRRWL